jgi:hypothetical protein
VKRLLKQKKFGLVFEEHQPWLTFIMAAADMNGDNTIDETEILQIVNIILGAK